MAFSSQLSLTAHDPWDACLFVIWLRLQEMLSLPVCVWSSCTWNNRSYWSDGSCLIFAIVYCRVLCSRYIKSPIGRRRRAPCLTNTRGRRPAPRPRPHRAHITLCRRCNRPLSWLYHRPHAAVIWSRAFWSFSRHISDPVYVFVHFTQRRYLPWIKWLFRRWTWVWVSQRMSVFIAVYFTFSTLTNASSERRAWWLRWEDADTDAVAATVHLFRYKWRGL